MLAFGRIWHRCLTGIVLALALALFLGGCVGGPPAPAETPEVAPTLSPQPAATETLTVVPPSKTATPEGGPTATPVRPQTPAAPSQTFTPAPPVVLIRPSAPAPPTTAQALWPTPVWPSSPLDHTDNLLVMGVDYRPGDAGWRTDTLMVIAMDAQSNQVGLLSIPRDLYLDIPGYGMGRINQADYIGETGDYPGGGQALLRRVLTETLGIPTQHYVRIRMEGLVRLVDTLGGVTVVLDCPLYERTPNESSPNGVVDWSLPAGPVLLDGESAKKFATYRYATTDFGRARRQQQLIWAIRDRALQVDIIPRIPELWKAFSDMFSTDLGLFEIVKLAGFGVALKPENVHGTVLGDDVMDFYITPEGAWVLVIADYDGIAAKKAQVFAQRPLATLNISNAEGGCPPPPTPPPTFIPTPSEENPATHTPAPAPTLTPTPGSTPAPAPETTPTPTATPS